MFVPIDHRAQIVQDVYNLLPQGGVFVLVEKVLGSTSVTDALLVSSYLGMKREAGYTEEQITRKKLALEGVLVPLQPSWTEGMLRQAGFVHVDTFWRCLNFQGWVAIK